MKKQINPNIKAHLIRGSFYVLLLLAVCVIPFALAQRNTAKRSAMRPAVAKPGAHFTTAPGSIRQRSKAPLSADIARPGHAPAKPVLRPAATKTNARARNLPRGTNLCPGVWNTSATGPALRYRAGGCTDGTFVYVYGGGDDLGNNYHDLRRWHPATETW